METDRIRVVGKWEMDLFCLSRLITRLLGLGRLLRFGVWVATSATTGVASVRAISTPESANRAAALPTLLSREARLSHADCAKSVQAIDSRIGRWPLRTWKMD